MYTLCSWFALLYICISRLSSQAPTDIDSINTTSNSSGQYFISNHISNHKIECDHSTLCYLECDHCQDFTFITNSTLVSVACIGCDYLKVYAEYATNVTMALSCGQYGYFHLQHAQHIDITSYNLDYSTIFARYAHYFRFKPLEFHNTGNRYNVFYLDYVSDRIVFGCSDGAGDSCKLEDSIIAAAHAKYFCFTDIIAYDNLIYCAHTTQNNIESVDEQNNIMYISNTSHSHSLNTTTDNWDDDNWSDVRYCNDGKETCHYILNATQKVIIYAQNANSLSIWCANCSQLNIFAQNAAQVSVHCVAESCDEIKMNAHQVATVYFTCDTGTYCRHIIINAVHSESVMVDADTMLSSEINALHASKRLDLTCNTQCDDVDIAIPSRSSGAKTSITCNGDDACNVMRIYSDNGRWNDIDHLSILSCNQSIYQYTENAHHWFLFCPSSLPVSHAHSDRYREYYRGRCTHLTAFKSAFCECDRLTAAQLVSALTTESAIATITYDPLATECVTFPNKYSLELAIIQQVFGFLIAMTTGCILAVWCILFIRNEVIFGCFYPQRYEEMTKLQAPSLHLFTYLCWSDVLIWFIQLYILILCWGIYNHWKYDICESIPVLSACELKPMCAIQMDGCTLPSGSIIYSFYVLSCVALCLSIVFVCFGSCSTTSDPKHDWEPEIPLDIRSWFLYELEAVFCLGIEWNRKMRNEYFSREFWPFTKQIRIYYLMRHCVFFIAPLLFYFAFDEDEIDFNIEWYDVFPPLSILLLNALIKKRYRMLPAYNRREYMRYILMNSGACAVDCALILSFVGDDDAYYDGGEEDYEEEDVATYYSHSNRIIAIAMSDDYDDSDTDEDEDDAKEAEEDYTQTINITSIVGGEMSERSRLI